MKQLGLYRFFIPPRYAFFRKKFKNEKFTLLDVGCGPSSYEIVKRYYPQVVYHAVDHVMQGSTEPYQKMDRFFNLDLQKTSFEEIPDNTYDVIVFSHTIEHIYNGLDVLKVLTSKLKNGGLFYVELPSEQSMFFPPAAGTLNFYDDPTHVRLYSLRELGNAFLEKNVRVLRAGKARNVLKTILITPFGIAYNALHFLRHGRLSARGLTDVLGYADYILGEKHGIPMEQRLGDWRETFARLELAPNE